MFPSTNSFCMCCSFSHCCQNLKVSLCGSVDAYLFFFLRNKGNGAKSRYRSTQTWVYETITIMSWFVRMYFLTDSKTSPLCKWSLFTVLRGWGLLPQCLPWKDGICHEKFEKGWICGGWKRKHNGHSSDLIKRNLFSNMIITELLFKGHWWCW